MSKIAVLGAGSWGTALAIVLADNGHEVRLWAHRKEHADEMNQTHRNEKYLDVEIPDTITAFYNMEEAVKDAEAIIVVVPTKAIREVCQQLKNYISSSTQIIHATKGIEPGTLKRVSEMMSEEMPAFPYENIVVLSGPSHAEEVALRHPTTVAVSAVNLDRARQAQDLFNSENLRVYTSDDILGIEVGGALKKHHCLGSRYLRWSRLWR